jgi:hypothetical protein
VALKRVPLFNTLVLDNKQLTANTDNCYNKMRLMPSPSADSKFVLSVLKFLGILKFLSYTQNILGILK